MESPWAGCAGGAGRGQAGVAAAVLNAMARTNASSLMPDNPFIVLTCGIMSSIAAGGAYGPDDHAEATGTLQGPREPHVGALRRAAGPRARALSRGACHDSGRRHGV